MVLVEANVDQLVERAGKKVVELTMADIEQFLLSGHPV